MTTIERLNNFILQVGHSVNCGPWILTLLPFFAFIVYVWLFAQAYIFALIIPNNGPRHRNILENKNEIGQYILMLILTSILAFSAFHCWSYGLILFLDKYTIVFLTIINNSLNSNYTMNQTTVLELEHICKLVVCCSVVYFTRTSYLRFLSKHEDQRHERPRSRHRLYNNTLIYNNFGPERATNELGENGILLMFDQIPPRPRHHPSLVENANTTQVRHTQSCIFPQKIGKILKVKKRNSVI